MPILSIDDIDDPRIAAYRNVPDRELLERCGLFVAEGRLVVRRLLTTSPLRARSVMVTEAARSSLSDILPADSLPICVVSQAVMNEVTGFDLHRGCLAIGERPAPADWRALAARVRRVVILERVGNADNVGAIFRNAMAFGVDAVLLGPDCVDPLYRKAIRTSMAATLMLPFARIEPWPDGLRMLRDQGCATIALTPAYGAAGLREVASCVTTHTSWAVVLGHEGDGLTPAAMEACEYRARIPIIPSVDSLNVATAAAIALYQMAADDHRTLTR